MSSEKSTIQTTADVPPIKRAERDRRVLTAIDALDVEQPHAEAILDVREAYLHGEIDEEELEERLEGAAQGVDTGADFSERDASIPNIIAGWVDVATVGGLRAVSDPDISVVDRHRRQLENVATDPDEDRTIAEAAALNRAAFAGLQFLSFYGLSTFFGWLPDAVPMSLALETLCSVLWLISIGLLLCLFAADLPAVKRREPGRGVYVSE